MDIVPHVSAACSGTPQVDCEMSENCDIWRRLQGCGEGTILSRLWFCLAAQPGRPNRPVNAFAERSMGFIWSYHPFRAYQIPLDGGGLCRPDMEYNTHREPQWDGAGLGTTSDALTAPDATARAALVPQNSPVGRQKRGENRPKSGSHANVTDRCKRDRHRHALKF